MHRSAEKEAATHTEETQRSAEKEPASHTEEAEAARGQAAEGLRALIAARAGGAPPPPPPGWGDGCFWGIGMLRVKLNLE